MKLKGIITTTMLFCSLNVATAGENLLKNGSFSNKKLTPWKLFATEGGVKPTSKIKDGVITITSTKISPKSSNELLTQKLEGIKSETKYKLSYDAKSTDITGQLLTNLSRSKDYGKGHYGFFRKTTLTKEWKTYTFHFTSKKIDEGNSPQLKIHMGKLKGDIQFRNIKLVEGKAKAKEKEEVIEEVEVKILEAKVEQK